MRYQVLDEYDKYLIFWPAMEEMSRAGCADTATDIQGVTTERVTIRLDRSTTTVDYRNGDTLLQTARIAGLSAPSSCEVGNCGTCMARLTEGSARMINNDALTEEEVAEGWVLTCQSLPTSESVTVVYE
jgi:ferredoxin